MMNNTNCPVFQGADIKYTVITVIVFAGSPSSDALTEAYRRHFDNERDARRFARTTVTTARMNFQTCQTYTPPCASVFEDSPSRGLGRHIAEYTSSARRRYLKSLEVRHAA
jgi:hypothetical protein